ncbi:regulator of sigma E protease [Trypanosoma cruzi]|nr:regulator of sigma E protease [Trypanosoma cruzi]
MPSRHREPTANATRGKWGHNQRPYSGWTSRRSACRLKAAGTVSSARVFSCAKVKAPFLQPNAPSKEFTVQRQKKTQCLLLPHGSVVDALMPMGAHRSFQTPLHTCNASCALRCILPTVNKINLAVGGDYIVKESGILQGDNKATSENHTADIITKRRNSARGRGVTSIN